MDASDSVPVAPVTPKAVDIVPRSSGDASTVAASKLGTSRFTSRVVDGVSKPKMEVAEGNLQLEDTL